MVVVDGLQYKIKWATMKRGWSVFVPCLDAEAGCRALLRDARAHNRTIFVRIVIENGIQGVRAWRMH